MDNNNKYPQDYYQNYYQAQMPNNQRRCRTNYYQAQMPYDNDQSNTWYDENHTQTELTSEKKKVVDSQAQQQSEVQEQQVQPQVQVSNKLVEKIEYEVDDTQNDDEPDMDEDYEMVKSRRQLFWALWRRKMMEKFQIPLETVVELQKTQ